MKEDEASLMYYIFDKRTEVWRPVHTAGLGCGFRATVYHIYLSREIMRALQAQCCVTWLFSMCLRLFYSDEQFVHRQLDIPPGTDPATSLHGLPSNGEAGTPYSLDVITDHF